MFEMLINKRLLKELRASKLWSQDELATACDVSLRTIQRAEGEAYASAETVKALASVFEVKIDEITLNPKQFVAYQNTQLGSVLLLIMLIVLVVQTWLFQADKLSLMSYQVSIFLIGVVIIVFSTLSTHVDQKQIRWRFGLGLIRKSVAVSEVLSHRPVRNKFWWGVGIRLIPGGLLYNVSGLDAVELVLKGGKRVRIGTDEPQEFSLAIESAINYSY